MSVFSRWKAGPAPGGPASPGGGGTEASHDAAIRAASDNAALRNLILLIRLRWFALVGQVMAIALTVFLFKAKLPVGPMLTVIAISAAINLAAVWRSFRERRVRRWTLTVELLFDVIALTILLYFSGGASNPFVTLYFLQVMLALVLIPMPQVLAILGAAVLAYFWLLNHGLPLTLPQHLAHGSTFMSLHLEGMFLGFVLSVGLLTWILRGIQGNLATRDAQIGALRQQIVEDEHFVRLGVMASSTAHELGTPLTTVAVTLDDWAQVGLPPEAELKANLAQMQAELASCRRIVSHMLFAAGLDRFEAAESILLGDFLEELVADWHDDGGTLKVRLPEGEIAQQTLLVDALLEQALRNILTNSGQAGAQHMTIRAGRSGAGGIILQFEDDGPGFPDKILAHPIRPVQAEKGNPGRGFGLYLVSNAVRRLGGDWRIENRAEGGARVVLVLPP
ncbi:hypothetical protein KM176_03200 [Pseudooceanicola sp. CBS1P-1]|uniref:histidine kinase n=1 Tax=Pseudooceanicola albus TaxID=2692189 RepID=A0A6L7G9L1_9RHOB|nr:MULTISPECIES: ATP-binding protein [Pseudooceanicola]MBT9382858.1 hypothetical protein [Pseudooceanicola endophyticus]MXN20218.1 hypothetical protein [Pseudooceanicola albus]